MISTLNNLINEVLLAKIRSQKYEIELLQSQINPHFLYNSLSLINSKAIIAGHSDISQMARLLSTFYRTTLNKGQQITTIVSELENTKSYIAIQQMMHSHSFDVVYDIDERVSEYPIPNLLLHPLAENAIIHGWTTVSSPAKRSCPFHVIRKIRISYLRLWITDVECPMKNVSRFLPKTAMDMA